MDMYEIKVGDVTFHTCQLVDLVVNAGSAACCINVMDHCHLSRLRNPGACGRKSQHLSLCFALKETTHITRPDDLVSVSLGANEEDCLGHAAAPPRKWHEVTVPLDAAVGVHACRLACQFTHVSFFSRHMNSLFSQLNIPIKVKFLVVN